MQHLEPLLSLRDIRFAYRALPVLDLPSWDFHADQQWVCLGPNGAGKTTLAGLLTGQLHHASGKIRRSDALAEGGVAYVCFEQQKALCERDGRLYANDVDDPGTTVAAAIGIGNREGPLADQWIARLGIKHVLERGIRFISTGEMRKTLLLRAILSHPSLLILDSPLDGLDASSQKEMATIIDELLQSETRVLLLCRQLADLPAGISHVLVLDRGQILASGERPAMLQRQDVLQLMSPPLPAELFVPPQASIPPQAPSSTPPQTTSSTPPPVPSPPPSADEVLIQMRQVSVSYRDVPVLDRVDWTLRRGQHCAISGPNGCGKTTLLSLINGDSHKAYGQDITLFGQRRGSGESVWDIRQKFGLLDTRLHLGYMQGMTALEVVLSGFFDTIGLYDDWGDRQRQVASQWLAALDMEELEQVSFDTLSFGAQRMVLLARAMVKSPMILMLDEPCLGLDGHHTEVILRAIDLMAVASDTQVLFVSHTADETPQCINQWLEFVPSERGGFTVTCRE